MGKLTLTFWLFASLLAFPAAGDEVSAPEFLSDAREFITEQISEDRIPSAAVAVSRGGDVIWAEGFGLADVGASRPATAGTLYWLASVSKPITATALMTLVESGAVSLNDPANRYLPGSKLRAYAGDADEITIRTLLTHTSGLPTHWNFSYGEAAPFSVDESIRRFGFAATAPGTRYNYSNLGFGVLNQISANVSGSDWPAFMNETLFKPAGMNRSSTWGPETHPDEWARPYEVNTLGQFSEVALYHFDHPGASTIWSSANDLIRFMQLHLNDGTLDGTRILAADTVRAMRESISNGQTMDDGYAFGWGVNTYRGQTRFSHGGGMPGVSTSVSAFPETNTAIVVLTNCSQPALADTISERIARELFAGTIPEKPEFPNDASETNSEPVAGEWSGRLAHHAGDVPLRLVVKDADEAIAHFGGGTGQRLENVAAEDGRFSGAFTGIIDRYPHFHGPTRLSFDLRLEAGMLRGVLYATADNYFRLPYWVELEQK